ncbi:MAG: PA4642 family protein [Cellvibrionaceae bacterium]|nr:PA4642 family protein [Cellvibrionaceae bacterium]
MTLKKDKQKVLGETFDDERIKTFLNYRAYGDANPDFHLLEKAYRGMKADNFATFIDFFVDAGHDLNSKNPEGLSFLTLLKQHRHAEDYIKVLIAKGAH